MLKPYEPDNVKPHYPTTLDIETIVETGQVLAVGFAYQDENNIRHYKVFNNWQEFLHYYRSLCKQNPKLERLYKIYAHYGGGFDWLSFLEYIAKTGQGNLHKAILVNGDMIGGSIKLNGLKRLVRIMDSYRLIPSGLNDLSKMFPIEHPKLDLQDKRLPEQVLKENPELFYKYLKHDVLGLQEIIKAFWQSIYDLDGSIGSLPMTLASLSLRLWRIDLEQTLLPSWNKKLTDFERRSYTGGRVELFKPGINQNIRTYDINSLYPSVMYGNQFPTSYKGAWVYSYQPGDYGLFEGEYQQTNTKLPPLLRDENQKEFTYTGSGVFTHYDLEKLHQIGGTFTVKIGYVYYETAELFTPFISKWYNRRLKYKKENNQALQYVSKILMNSLYGKFGQKPTGYSIQITDLDKTQDWINKNLKVVNYGDLSVYEEKTQSEHIFVAIASMVTSLARLKLYEFMEQIVTQGETLIYCDTDSIHTTGTLPSSKNLGAMKLEHEGNGIHLARKLYQLTTPDYNPNYRDKTQELTQKYHKENRKVVAKGVGSDAHYKLTHQDFIQMALGDQIRVDFDTFPTTNEVLLQNQEACVISSRHRTIRITEKQSQFKN